MQFAVSHNVMFRIDVAIGIQQKLIIGYFGSYLIILIYN